VDVDLEVKVAADRDRVAGLPHRAHLLSSPDSVVLVNQGRAGHVGVEVTAVLAFAVDQQVVAVEDWVVTGPEYAAVADRYKWCIAGRHYVEALVGATAAAGSAEFTYRAACPVRTLDRKEVVVIGKTTITGGGAGGDRCD